MVQLAGIRSRAASKYADICFVDRMPLADYSVNPLCCTILQKKELTYMQNTMLLRFLS
jgi:hypothetical protein